MSYIDEIFKRTNWQNIREFLLHGVEEYDVSKETYRERLKNAERQVGSYLRSFYEDNKEYEEATMPVYDYANVIEDVYMEIGLQCGVLLALQIMENTNSQIDTER